MAVEDFQSSLSELNNINDLAWLAGAECCLSPNADIRPQADDISLLVIHNISLPPGEYGSGCVEQFFCNKLDHLAHPYFQEIVDLKVSAHLLIERSGRVVQFVPFTQRAWHAGVSSFEGRERCNDFSVGIELEGQDNQAYTESQYQVLLRVTRLLMDQYPKITVDRIVGHCHIAAGRKTDPGDAFDWQYYKNQL